MRLWPPSGEARAGASAPDSSTTLSPHTGNRRLDRQLRAARESELREVPAPTVASPELAARARRLMLDACGGVAPRLASDDASERARDDFLDAYFTRRKMDELPAIEAGADEVGGVLARLQVSSPVRLGGPGGGVLTRSSGRSFGARWCRFWGGSRCWSSRWRPRHWLAWFSRDPSIRAATSRFTRYARTLSTEHSFWPGPSLRRSISSQSRWTSSWPRR
jgi:hypothetical protein